MASECSAPTYCRANEAVFATCASTRQSADVELDAARYGREDDSGAGKIVISRIFYTFSITYTFLESLFRENGDHANANEETLTSDRANRPRGEIMYNCNRTKYKYKEK